MASALSAAATVAVALVIAGAALVLLVEQSLQGSAEERAVTQAEQLAERLAGNFVGNERGNAIEAIDAVVPSDGLAQIVIDYIPDDSTPPEVLSSSDPLDELPPVTDLMLPPGEVTVIPSTWMRLADGNSTEVVMVVRGAYTLGRHLVVVTATPLDSVHAATETVLYYLLIGVPILIVVVGTVTYLFAGRALRPVEAIRAQVASMTERDLGKRVPVPAARDEVRRLAETMNAMLARLQDAQGVQRRFVADASHELRSPLATIATGLELLAREKGTPDPAAIATLRGETARLSRLVDDLLMLARADERGLQPRREEVDLDEVVQAERARPTQSSVRLQVRAEPARVIGDRSQLARAVRNLVDNACRHARNQVIVTVRRDNAHAVVEVADDGPGVPPADRKRVFERFVRLDDSRTRSEGGAGLGLAIVAEVAAAHGGTVEVTEAWIGGALFRLTVPLAPDAVVAAPSPRPRPGTTARAAPDEESSGSAAGSSGTSTASTTSAADLRSLWSVPVRTADARRDPPTVPLEVPDRADEKAER